jgi:t-SNARE complex subunit (syntaxin)
MRIKRMAPITEPRATVDGFWRGIGDSQGQTI